MKIWMGYGAAHNARKLMPEEADAREDENESLGKKHEAVMQVIDRGWRVFSAHGHGYGAWSEAASLSLGVIALHQSIGMATRFPQCHHSPMLSGELAPPSLGALDGDLPLNAVRCFRMVAFF
jgi:hypothetical protein